MIAPIAPTDRVALLMRGALRDGSGKMGFGLLRYSRATIAAVVDGETAGDDAARHGAARSAPVVATVREAGALGANVLVIGIAPPGGRLPEEYRSDIREALSNGMSVVNGLHSTLADDPEFALLVRPGRRIVDVRREPEGIGTGAGLASGLPCPRVLTVGTDMAAGKMTAALEMQREAQARGMDARFVASGQIGICISGDGVPLDAVRVDYASGSVEEAVLRIGAGAGIVFVEGQGAVTHPASTAWLPLMRGSCPTHLVLVHRAGQRLLSSARHAKVPPLAAVIAAYEAVSAACTVGPAARVVAVAVNTGHMGVRAAKDAIAAIAAETGLPCGDPLRGGAAALLDAVLGAAG